MTVTLSEGERGFPEDRTGGRGRDTGGSPVCLKGHGFRVQVNVTRVEIVMCITKFTLLPHKISRGGRSSLRPGPFYSTRQGGAPLRCAGPLLWNVSTALVY